MVSIFLPTDAVDCRGGSLAEIFEEDNGSVAGTGGDSLRTAGDGALSVLRACVSARDHRRHTQRRQARHPDAAKRVLVPGCVPVDGPPYMDFF